MNKISISETILQGYGFAARRIVSNLGLSWLAAVFYALAAGYWLHAFCTTMLVSPHPGSEINDFALFDLFCLVVVTALGSAVIARILTGAALEPGGEIMTAYVAVAKREWILFLALLRLYALVLVALVGVVLLGGLAIAAALPMIGANVQWYGITALSAMNVAVALIAFGLISTLAVRLGFFAAPVASAENSSSMTRAWSLSSGNAWRLFAVVIGLSVPALLLWAAAEWALIGGDLPAALTIALSLSHNSTALYQLLDDNAAVIACVWAVLMVALNMLFAGASAEAYVAVRDNVTVRQPRSVSRTPILEPSFAGSFAGFGPRDGTEPFANSAQAVSETFAPAPEIEAPVAAAHLPTEPMPEHEPLVLADEMHEAPLPAVQDEAVIAEAPEIVADFSPSADTPSDMRAEHVEAAQPDATEPHAELSAITPPPSHGDATESSQQNAPSEAA